MATCGSIVKGFYNDPCGKTAVSGTEVKIRIANYADVDVAATLASNNVDGGALKNIVMKKDKKFFPLTSKAKSTEGTSTYSVGTYGGYFDHSVTLRAFTKSQEVKDFMNSLKDARVVVIVENIEGGSSATSVAGGTKFEVYGLESGLIMTEMPWSTTLSDQVTYSATLASDDENKESQLPYSLFATSLDNTNTVLDSITEGASAK